MMQTVVVHGTDVPIIEVQGGRVVTLAMMDKVHQRPTGTARRTFNEHRNRLASGRHFIEINQADEIRTLGLERPQGGVPEKVILLTERGYLMLVKSFTDDLAWQVQDELIEGYFRQTAVRAPRTMAEALRLAADEAEAKERAEAALLESRVEIDELRPRAAALQRIADAGETLNLTELAKVLGMRRIDLREDLVARKWIWKRPGGKHWLGYDDKVQQKLVVHKVDTVQREDGSEKIVEQVRFTAKGVAKLAEIYEREAAERARNSNRGLQ